MKTLAALLFGSMLAFTGCVGMDEQTGDQSSEVKTAPQLNLSHIACAEDGTVTAHFVLLFAGKSNPGTLTVTYNGGTITGVAPEKNTGNVWHYNVTLPEGYIDVLAANVGTTTLHNPGEYAGDYQCGNDTQTCSVEVTAGLLCADTPFGNPGDECGALGLTVLGKDDNLTGLTWTSTMDAYVAIVKAGTQPCGPGNAAYQVYTNVSVGSVLTSPSEQNISHVTYCACPDGL